MAVDLLHSDYAAFLAALKARVIAARTTAARAESRELVLLYWDIGRDIVEEQETVGWGTSVAGHLTADLRAAFSCTRGSSAACPWWMRQFFVEHSTAEFLEQAVPELKRLRGRILEQPVPEPAPRSGFDQSPEALSRQTKDLLTAIPWDQHLELQQTVRDPTERKPSSKALSRGARQLADVVREVLPEYSYKA
jgi:hypothetical protein